MKPGWPGWTRLALPHERASALCLTPGTLGRDYVHRR